MPAISNAMEAEVLFDTGPAGVPSCTSTVHACAAPADERDDIIYRRTRFRPCVGAMHFAPSRGPVPSRCMHPRARERVKLMFRSCSAIYLLTELEVYCWLTLQPVMCLLSFLRTFGLPVHNGMMLVTRHGVCAFVYRAIKIA